MACSLSHTIDKIQALVTKLIEEYIIRQKAFMELAVQFENASATKSDVRKAYEKCYNITHESRALIDTFLKQESNKDYEMNLALYRKAAKIEKQIESRYVPIMVVLDLSKITKSLYKLIKDLFETGSTSSIIACGSETLIKKILTRRTLYSLKEMDLESAQNNVVAKLPPLKQGDYEMYKLRIEQYFQVQDYALWDVIENENSFKPVPQTTANTDGTSTSTIPGPVTTEEKAQKKNDVKFRSMLLMALPNERILTFSQYKDDKTLFKAIQARFGGNDAIKKTQKTLLKQMYENFNAPSTDLPSEWNTHVVVWRNEADLDTMRIDDVYNNFKIVEQKVKRTVTTSSSLGSQNMACLSSPDSTNKVDTTNIQLALLSMRARRYFQRTGKKITINGSDTDGYDKTKVECFNCHKMRHFATECRSLRNQESRPRNQDSSRKTVNVEDTSSKAMVAIDGAGFDWSHMADDEAPTNMALMAFSDSEAIMLLHLYLEAYLHPQLLIYPTLVLRSSNTLNLKDIDLRPGDPQDALKDQGYFDSGCSRHLTENISYLTDFKEHDEGYVAFRRGAKGGKITGKGTIRTGKLDFNDVYFVKEL
nr:ribonuclease H-like domain-containing protein [Tanacetum cinerariifolium]